tara:strand:+ start:2960 stop:5374 length:2415 start_codon:yes stop_codon:yes gene_type:complete
MAIEEILNNPTGEEIESVRDLTPAEEEIIVQEDGTAEVTLEDKPLMEEAKAMGLFDDEDLPMDVQDHSANLAEILDDSDLRAIGSELLDSFERDQNSREEYDTIAEEGVDLLGFKSENSDEPFPGAASASHPVLAQAVVKFQAKAYKELFPTEGPIRTRIVGSQTPQKMEQANRVRHFMNYQTQIQMPEYGPELDRLLFYVSLYGSAFKKTYWDVSLQRPRTEYIKAQDFYIDYYASDLETAERFTHKYSMSMNEIKKFQIAETFRDIDVQESTVSESNAEDASNEVLGLTKPFGETERVEILEMHVNLDIPGFEDPDGLKLPYIVHMTDEGVVLAIRKNWNEDDVKKEKKMYFTHYYMIPGLGFYGYGYIHLIGGLTKTATSSMRQLIDAGTFANLPGGFKAHGLRVLAPDEPIAPGEWREVNSPAGDLSKSLQPLPFKEPSGTLYNLMQYVVNAAKEFADSADNIVENSSNYGPVGTTMALLEQSSKLFSAVHKRLHNAQSKDLRILARLDHEYLPDMYPYEVAGGAQQVFREDFNLKSIDVIPVSDPNMPTEAHRIAKVNAVMQIAQQNPNAYNMEAIGMELFSAMGIEEPQRYLKAKQQPISADPVTENMAAMKGAPLQPKPEQNHDAHIVAHASLINNPAYKENMPMVQTLASHIQEHLAMKYRSSIVQMIQDPQLQQAVMSGQPLPPEMENQIALFAANASDSILKLDEEKAKIMSGEKKSVAEQQLEIQQADLDLRKAKLALDSKIHSDEMGLEEAKLMIDDENTDLERQRKETKDAMDLAKSGIQQAKITIKKEGM